MKILIDARLYGLENAGIGRYVMNLVGELEKIDRENNYVIILGEKYFNELNLARDWKKVLFRGRHYGWAEQWNLPKVIELEKPDLVHFPHFNVPIRYRGKYVVTIHDMLMHKQKGVAATTLPRAAYYTKRLGYKIVFASAVKRAEKVIVPSNCVREEVARYYKMDEEKFVVTYEGVDGNIKVDQRRMRAVLRKYDLGGKYFVYAGNAYPHKNLGRAIEAVVLLNKQVGERIVLAIATARNVFEKRLEKKVIELGAEEYVKLLGFVPDEDLGNIYNQSLGFVFPTLLEGFGLPGLEAMSAGTLALVSDIPVLKEVYGDKAIYFNPHDFSSMAKMMRYVLEMTAAERKRRIREGERYVKKYSWEKMARETLKVYKQSL